MLTKNIAILNLLKIYQAMTETSSKNWCGEDSVKRMWEEYVMPGLAALGWYGGQTF